MMPLTREDLENDALRKQYEHLRDLVPLLPALQFDASLESALSGWDDAQDLWVFAYGSLIWNPLIHFVEQRRALLRGFHWLLSSITRIHITPANYRSMN